MDGNLQNDSLRDVHCDGQPDAILQPAEELVAASESFYVVGVGASAGGLEALETFFEHMPSDAGMAFVVVQHLSPDFKSLMDELLSRRTEIAIHRVEDGMAVEPNSIYLIPPKKEMIISGGRLLLTDKDPATGLSLPIDTFFRSLAQDCGNRAVGIILSGTGSDGSRGIRAVHDAGGLVIAQNEETAKFDGMPRSAVETGVVDLVLPPAEMAKALLDYIQHPVHGAKTGNPIGKLVSETGMNAVYSLLRAECGIDFSHYKPNTVLRRIDRRLQLNRSDDLDEYVEQLRIDAQERNSLYKDLLIGVTRFFRDPELFERLKAEVIPETLAKVSPDDEIRAWVAGCATGEEAYSLAILFHEALAEANRPFNIKIFATDVHRVSLEFASAGLYDEAALTEVSTDRLERYFAKQAAKYQVSQELRKMIVFAPHNIIKDAPFTKLDLISCRNLLIYLQSPAQQKALSLFHFGLKTGGVLTLGPSESPGDISDEFETLDGHWKVYRKRRDIRLPTDMRLPLSPLLPQLQAVGAALRSSNPAFPDPNLLKAYDELLGAYVPPSFLITLQRELIHTFAGAGRYLRVPDGRPSTDLLDMVDNDLRLAISGALQRAAKEGGPVGYGGVSRQSGGDEERLRVSVRPFAVRGTGETYFLVSLELEQRPRLSSESIGDLNVGAASALRLVELEDELRYTKENLQATVEEMETSNEELQATNEELVASNEELQSTNEELHSVNEELYTVNAEYQRKIAELTELTDDIDNLLRSTDVGTIFLDRELLIRKFTPKIAHAFQLLPQDIGRRIDSFAHNILHEGLLDDVRRVLETSEPIERDVQDRLGEWYLLRILPYRTKDKVEGVVVTLIAISRLKATEKELRRLSKVFMDGADPIIIEDLSGTIIDLNREAERVYGWSRVELLGQPVSTLIPVEEAARIETLRDRCRTDDSIRNVESLRCDRAGNVSPVLLTLSLLNDEAGEPAAIASIAKDITTQKEAEREAREAASRRDQFLAMLSHELRNPLGAMLNAARLFERVESHDAALAKACSIIDRQSKQMARLLDDLLDVSRVTQGKIQISKQLVDLRASAEEAIQVVQPLVESRAHTLVMKLPDHAVYVEGDPARLLQVQENLLENAAKYTPDGGMLRLTLRAEDGEAILCVKDNGVGIAPEMQAKIFELFVQAPPVPVGPDTGMGIGLTLVQSIVHLHNGQVGVRSEGIGKGSEFEIRLPLTQKRPNESRPATPAPEAGINVVIVEDNADSREMLESLLRMDGYEVRTAEDGLKGYEAILAHGPDVALVDIGLPGMNGYEVARKVRAEMGGKPIRLVALTGYGRKVDRDAVFEAGFDEHLVKPVDPDDLVRVLRKPR
jgi:two-component system, chemotaxis family, CheB/CheR fusion protein